MLAFGPLGVVVAAAGSTGCNAKACPAIAYQRRPAIFDLSCASTDLTAVDVSGPCAVADAGTSPGFYVRGGQIAISSDVAGVCHVQLTFVSGPTYSTAVTFSATVDDCGTTSVEPTQSTFTVDNPSSTCADGGSDARSDGP
jgi:hypothetical protein